MEHSATNCRSGADTGACRYLVDVEGQHVSAGFGLRRLLRLPLHLVPVRPQVG